MGNFLLNIYKLVTCYIVGTSSLNVNCASCRIKKWREYTVAVAISQWSPQFRWSPSHHGCFNTKSWFNDLDDLGVAPSIGNLKWHNLLSHRLQKPSAGKKNIRSISFLTTELPQSFFFLTFLGKLPQFDGDISDIIMISPSKWLYYWLILGYSPLSETRP